MTRRVYIAGCYSAVNGRSVADHIAIARTVAIEVWQSGNYAWCPHLNTAHFDDAIDNLQLFYDGTLDMLSACDAIVMCPYWQDSKGAIAELKYAKNNGISIYYYPEIP